MENYLVQSYFLLDTYQPSVLQYIDATKVEIKDHLVIFSDDKEIVVSFDLTNVFFTKVPEVPEEIEQDESVKE